MMGIAELSEIADGKNIMIDSFALESREALSIMDVDGSCYIAIDPDKIQSDADEKMKMAHELGHCITGSFYNQWAACDVRQKHENRADKWAIEHLAPMDELYAAIADGYTDFQELAERFDLSEDFVKKAICFYKYGNLATDLYF